MQSPARTLTITQLEGTTTMSLILPVVPPDPTTDRTVTSLLARVLHPMCRLTVKDTEPTGECWLYTCFQWRCDPRRDQRSLKSSFDPCSPLQASLGLASFHCSSLYPVWDETDRIILSLNPFVNLLSPRISWDTLFTFDLLRATDLTMRPCPVDHRLRRLQYPSQTS